MIPKFRAWSTDKKIMAEVRTLRFTDELVETDKFVERSIEGVKLMQSTGLLDKNGKEIFEGDILKVKIMSGQSWLETVRYNDEKAMFVSKEVKRKVLESPLYDLFITDLFEVEVIGNIYENPELVEVEI